jgi:putative flippase GtrA
VDEDTWIHVKKVICELPSRVILLIVVGSAHTTFLVQDWRSHSAYRLVSGIKIFCTVCVYIRCCVIDLFLLHLIELHSQLTLCLLISFFVIQAIGFVVHYLTSNWFLRITLRALLCR